MSATKQTIHTYHCICTQLVLASTSPLDSLKSRSSDSSLIVPVPNISQTAADSHYASLVNTVADSKPTVIRRDDGFEKRYFHKCSRCDLILAYSLDRSQFDDTKALSGVRDDLVFVIPGGLMSTEEMKLGKEMDTEITKAGVKAV